MTDSDNNSKRPENIFEVLDEMMHQLGKSRKVFMIMILSTLILPPLALLMMTSIFDPPINEELDARLLIHLENGDITEEEYENIKEKIIDRGRTELFLKPPQLVIFIISIVWLGIGIKQWISVSKWDKRYQRFKAQQKDIDKKLSDEPEDE